MSEIDGRLTTQLSRSSMLSGTTVTPTLTGDTERKMFDNTMITAYDSSTFRRLVKKDRKPASRVAIPYIIIDPSMCRCPSRKTTTKKVT